MELRDTITFVLQKALTVIVAFLGITRLTDTRPAETSLALSRMVVGAVLLAVAAIAEVMVLRSQLARRKGSGAGGSDDHLAEQMKLLERALIDRLPPTLE